MKLSGADVRVMVGAGRAAGAVPPLYGGRVLRESESIMLSHCDTKIVSGPPCDGHLGKFDNCLAEALWEISLEDHNSTGDGDFEGHYGLVVIVGGDEDYTVNSDGQARTVTIPEGNYIVRTWTTGGVSIWTYDTPAEAEAEWHAAGGRYDLWQKGCDPNDAAGHEVCDEYDDCQIPQWSGI